MMIITSLISGLVLGLSAGFSPGPLSTLVISQTVKYGLKEGLKVALAPLMTDLPIVLIAVLLLSRLANSHTILGIISFAGGVFVCYLAYESFRTTSLDTTVSDVAPQSWLKGFVVNMLSPNPYLFWITVGAPTMLKAWSEHAFAAVAFVFGFYLCLIGAKMTLAIVSGQARQWLLGNVYVYLMRVLGVLLLIFAGLLFKDGMKLLGK